LISNQIVKVNGKNKLVEFLDSLVVPRKEFYAYQHSGNGEKKPEQGDWYPYSRIKIRILDYSAKEKGGDSVFADFNLTPGQIRCLAKDAFSVPAQFAEYKRAETIINAVNDSFNSTITAMNAENAVAYNNALQINSKLSIIAGLILKGFDNPETVLSQNQKERLKASLTPSRTVEFKNQKLPPLKYEFTGDKITPIKGQKDKGRVTKLTISFKGEKEIKKTVNGSSEPTTVVEEARYPWTIQIENGTGVPEETNTGGTACKKGTFKKEAGVFIQLTNADFQDAMLRVVSFIDTFEIVNSKLVREGKTAYEAEQAQIREEKKGE